MGFNEDFVVDEILLDTDFEIMNQEEIDGEMVLTIVHNMHPDDEFKVKLVTKDAEGEDTMVLQFDGPDSYTEEEAKQVLQEVMDMLVKVIEKAIDEAPTPAEDLPEGTPDPEQPEPEETE